jgi:beta-glucanase (GH16 family)
MCAADEPEKALIDLTDDACVALLRTDQPDQVSVARVPDGPGVVITCRPGKSDYPGITLTPKDGSWDLSAFGHVEAKVANVGAVTSGVSLRIDNEGDWTLNPWNSETAWLKPGESSTLRIRFGYSWGKPGFALDPAKVIRLLLFVGKAEQEQAFRVESLVAGGAPGEKPPVDPNRIRTKPPGGVLLGKGSALDPATQLTTQGGAQADLSTADGAQSLRATLPAGAGEASALLKPAVGMWDLRDWLQVQVSATNEGQAPITLRARLENPGRPGTWVESAEPLAPGAEGAVTLPFPGPPAIFGGTGGPKSGGSSFESDRASGISISATGEGERLLRITSVRAVLPEPAAPDWLGQRPPVPGDWTQTLNENFDGPALDETHWSIYYPNYWDKRAHFTKDNVLLGDGVLRLRFERKRGHAEDDPAKPETDWATGFLTSIGKFRQRYGYFECRMKLPTAPGLWPAFWMMPDRGPDAKEGRESTADGGMEFDILEFLTRYGPNRYNIAAHWDNYGKDHKSNGTERIYAQPDREGFITAGLLWEPGKATWYANGEPVAEWTDARIASVPEYILFTAVSGGWGGNDLTGEGLPDDFVLDYVRVWQRSDWAEGQAP